MPSGRHVRRHHPSWHHTPRAITHPGVTRFGIARCGNTRSERAFGDRRVCHRRTARAMRNMAGGGRYATALSEHWKNLSVTLTVNGIERNVALEDPRVALLDLLRERLDLTGT